VAPYDLLDLYLAGSGGSRRGAMRRWCLLQLRVTPLNRLIRLLEDLAGR